MVASVLSFDLHVGSRNKIGVVSVAQRAPFPLSHLIGPSLLFRSVMLTLISFYVDSIAM